MGFYNCTCYPEYTGNGTSCTGRFLDNTISFYHVLLLLRNATGVSNALLNSNVCKSFIRCLGRPSVILKWPKFKTPIALKCFSSASVVFFSQILTSVQTTPIIVMSMLIVTIPWGPLIARVTLDTQETGQHVLVNMITLFSMKFLYLFFIHCSK